MWSTACALTLLNGAMAGDIKECTWIQDIDYRGVNNTRWVVGVNMSKEDCCELCQQTDGCDFTVWNPSARRCYHKTKTAVPFHRQGDLTCCPRGSRACPAAPEHWRAVPRLSDEFLVDANQGALLPLDKSKWEKFNESTGPAPRGWTWSADNTKTVSTLPGDPIDSELGEVLGSYLALTAQYVPSAATPNGTYSSGGVRTRLALGGLSFGRVEAKIRGASRLGVLPKFFLYRSDPWLGSLELDAVNLGVQEGAATAAEVGWRASLQQKSVQGSIQQQVHLDFDPRLDFHIYALEWNSSALTWSVDDEVVAQYPSQPFFDAGQPLDVALGLEISEELLRQPTAEGFPTTFFVDWVRTWQPSADSVQLAV